MNVAEQRTTFLEAMKVIREDRSTDVGEHTWRDYADVYGERILFAEIASITSRLKAVFWDSEYTTDRKARAEDLLVDLGNYAGFLYDYIQEDEQ